MLLWHNIWNILLLFDTCLHCVVMNAFWAIPHSAPPVMFDMTASGLCFFSQAKKGDTWYLSDLPISKSVTGLQIRSKCVYSKWIGKNPISLFLVLYILTRFEQRFSIWWIPSRCTYPKYNISHITGKMFMDPCYQLSRHSIWWAIMQKALPALAIT